MKENPDFYREQYDNDLFAKGSRWAKWARRTFFKEAVAKGNFFEKKFILPGLIDRDIVSGQYSEIYSRISRAAKKFFGANLDEYDLYSNVQLKYPKLIKLKNGKEIEYFTADQVFVKWFINPNSGATEIGDVIILENKLNSKARLTINQLEGFKASRLIVRNVERKPDSAIFNVDLLQGEVLNPVNKWLKVFDSDTGDVLSGIDKIKR